MLAILASEISIHQTHDSVVCVNADVLCGYISVIHTHLQLPPSTLLDLWLIPLNLHYARGEAGTDTLIQALKCDGG